MTRPSDRDPTAPAVVVAPVSTDNWRDVAALGVTPDQRDYVADPSYYLALCCYGGSGWTPLAMLLDDEVVGFLMWAVDPADGACWLGGVLVDASRQNRGIGRAGIEAALRHLEASHRQRHFALSYDPGNERARRLYARLGFRETGELEGDEIVARRR